MTDLFLSEGFFPFALALGFLLGLLLLELVSLLLVGSLMGGDGDVPYIDVPELDVAELDLDLDIDPAELELTDGAVPASTPVVAGGLAGWLGLGNMPGVIWLASCLVAFGLGGLTLQSAADAVFGAPLPAPLAILPAAVLAIGFTRSFGGLFERLLPRSETSVQTARQLSRRRGVITQGRASRGRPAEVRVIDRFGNTHYLRAEPLRDGTTLDTGTEVLVLRDRASSGYRLIPLSD